MYPLGNGALAPSSRESFVLEWYSQRMPIYWRGVAYLEMETHACSIPTSHTLCAFYREKATHALGGIPIQRTTCVPAAWPMIVWQYRVKRYWSRTWDNCTVVLLVIIPTDDQDSYCSVPLPLLRGVLLDPSSSWCRILLSLRVCMRSPWKMIP